jgi:Zn-dependent peptidase ImmA (M78 family)/DNA-binding XRE family transcriptional regulator
MNALGQRLKRLRLARGLSLEALAAEMGGIVTKQSLSKYEQDKAHPSAKVLNRLASVLGVKAANLYGEPEVLVKFLAYRKATKLSKKSQERLESAIATDLEARVQLQEKISPGTRADVPVQRFRIESLADAETAAESLRAQWNLGLDPIASLVAVLEDRYIYVFDIDAEDSFDGISAIAYSKEQELVAAATIARTGIAGERQRLNLAHELGHLVLDVSSDLDEEKAAFRFGAAFLAPAELVRQEIGLKRTVVDFGELLSIKQLMGMSLQALVYRLKDLNIISSYQYRSCCIEINRRGWKRREPEELPAEQPQWLRRNVLRAIAEGLIARDEAECLLKESIHEDLPPSLVRRRAFMRLPLSERKRLLETQADGMTDYYEEDSEWREHSGGKFY